MSHRHRTSIWQVELPGEWSVRALYFDGAVIYRADGVGQLGVMVWPEDMKPLQFNRQLDTKFSGQLEGFQRARQFGGSCTRQWTLFCGQRVLLIRYSCASAHAGAEDEEVDQIMGNIACAGEAD